MASNGASATEAKKVEETNPATAGASQIATASTTASPPSAAFKIVRVRKPDGTIVRVKRPIPAGEVNGSVSPFSTASPPKLSPKDLPLKPIGPSDASAATTSVKRQEVTTIPNTKKVEEGAKVTTSDKTLKPSIKEPAAAQEDTKATKSNKISTTSSSESAAKPPPKGSAPEPIGKTPLYNGMREASRFRFARGFRTLGQGITQTVVTFVPGLDLGDVGDLQDGDEYLDDDDNDDYDDDDDDDDNDRDQTSRNANQTQDDDSNSKKEQGQGNADAERNGNDGL
jgi:hypothetical protein